MSNGNWNRLLFGIVLLSVLWIYVSRVPTEAINAPAPANPQTGFAAPDFTLQTMSGQSMTLSKLRGKVVLVNVWASWCAPCRAEMPAIENVYQQYRDSGFVTLAVNATFQDSEVDAAAFAQRLGLTFPILLDTKGTVTQLYQVRALPTSFFIGRDGKIREVVFGGAMNEATIASKIQMLLNEGVN
jgi:peroxiredoxin